MFVSWLLTKMETWRERPAVIWQNTSVSYGEVLEKITFWKNQFDLLHIQPGHVIALENDFSPNVIALFLALIDRSAIIVPLTKSVEAHKLEFKKLAGVQNSITFGDDDRWHIENHTVESKNELTQSLIKAGEPGLILFSSGSTGKPKATLHNMVRFLAKFRTPQISFRTIALPLMDHVAGLDTFFYVVAGGGRLICLRDRSPETVCEAIERHNAELLPTTATFLNLLLLSEAYTLHDLSSLRIVAYGSELMPERTLFRLREILPDVNFIQKYGTTEFGSPRTRSKGENGSLWFKIDSKDFETKIVDGVLWVRASSSMLGYLNAPSPFDAEGWLNTGDTVEVDGEYLRIKGRESEIINVGGLKVYPTEVENLLMEVENVRDVTVHGEKNPITGTIVVARVNLSKPEPLSNLKKRIRDYCKDKLAPYKIPAKIEIINNDQFNARHKKMRSFH